MSSMKFTGLAAAGLGGFDREARELILGAIEAGCTGRISGEGRCILRNSTGRTATVSRGMTSQNRASQNTHADVRRLLQDHETGKPEEDRPSAAPEAPAINRAGLKSCYLCPRNSGRCRTSQCT